MKDDLQRLVDVDMKPGAAKRVMTIWREAMKDFKNLMTTEEKCLDKSPFTCEGNNQYWNDSSLESLLYNLY